MLIGFRSVYNPFKSIATATVEARTTRAQVRSAAGGRERKEPAPTTTTDAAFDVVRLQVDADQLRPFGVARRVGESKDILKGEVWDPIDITNLFGAYCARSPIAVDEYPRAAVLVAQSRLDVDLCLPKTVVRELKAQKQLKAQIDNYHAVAEANDIEGALDS